jgi:hypothetical protein
MTTKRPRRGRPRQKSDRTKCRSILLRLDPREKEAFSEAANVAGIPLAVWMRERLRRTATRELEEAARPIAFLTHLED